MLRCKICSKPMQLVNYCKRSSIDSEMSWYVCKDCSKERLVIKKIYDVDEENREEMKKLFEICA